MLLENVPEQNSQIWIWGTGNTSQLYQEGLARLNFFSQGAIKGYCDNNSINWGKRFNDKPIISPDELKKKDDSIVLICSPTPTTIREIQSQLNEMGMKNYPIETAILKWNRADVLEAYDALGDEHSRMIYANLVYARLYGNYPEVGTWSDNQYFAWNSFTTKDIGDVFLDCGAYVGDTVEKYIWNREGVFKKIIAFEPDKKNYFAMKNRVNRLKAEWNLESDMIEILPVGVGEKSILAKFDRNEANHGLGSKFINIDAENVEECQVVAIDEVVDEKCTFIKADIESFEYKMLLGAKKRIREWKPALAIAIYHNAIDFFSIILLVKELVPEYKLAVRHHSNTLAETVLYAWIEEI